MTNDDFEQMGNLKEVIEQLRIPFQQIQQQLDLLRPELNKIQTFRQSLAAELDNVSSLTKPLSESLKMLKNNPAFAELYKTQEVLKQLGQIRNSIIPIPDAIYPEINRLIDSLKKVIPKEGYSEIESSILVRKVDSEQQRSAVWTWEMLSWFVGLVLPLIASFVISNQTAAQLERHHQEDMKQRERHHQEVMNALSDFIERLEYHIHDQSAVSSDHVSCDQDAVQTGQEDPEAYD